MMQLRPRWRLAIVTLVLLAFTAYGVSLAFPGNRDGATAVRPYDPMPRW